MVTVPRNSTEILLKTELQRRELQGCPHFHRLFKSKQVTAEEEDDAAQAGVNNASKGGIIYGDYLQVEHRSSLMKKKREL